MKFYVEETQCETNGLCVKAYPELFRFKEGSKKATVIDSLSIDEYKDELNRIRKICPVNAIKLKS